ncbi:hypothetical protein [Phocaeicola vulgatus]|uniref:hypothetical protein n=1 Tax=Phocaeicola vulgatus TaxID=821 RepID=UPI00155E3126|nr:hypothetical protein [Phocaeicola vulgatus]NMW97469.1 hypothetical protein [Phocaeicola vulgatus]
MASGFPVLEPMGVPLRQIFRYKATEGRGGGERRSSCLRGKRPAASCRTVKSRSGSRKASNKREKD